MAASLMTTMVKATLMARRLEPIIAAQHLLLVVVLLLLGCR